MKAREQRRHAREARERGSTLLDKVRQTKTPERTLNEVRQLRSLVKTREKEVAALSERRRLFVGKSSPEGRNAFWQLDPRLRKGKNSRRRWEGALVEAEWVLSLNRAKRRRHLGERSS